MIKNNWSYDLYDSDNGWGMGLGAKDQKDGDVCTLADDEIEAADELMKKFNEFFTK